MLRPVRQGGPNESPPEPGAEIYAVSPACGGLAVGAGGHGHGVRVLWPPSGGSMKNRVISFLTERGWVTSAELVAFLADQKLTKEQIRSTIKKLVKNGLIEKRRSATVHTRMGCLASEYRVAP